ncbi:hypothetical protein [Aquibacillus sediminis]|uniref:hypothetical protein n=1 Tax=Aquibacillus sediminis TaxID=2574734 RepID=UPI0011085A3E|nr:hypothetical protein [Aquibacillus sediminis]
MKITTKENLNAFLMENQLKLEDYLHQKMEPLLASKEVEDSYREQLLSNASIIVNMLKNKVKIG